MARRLWLGTLAGAVVLLAALAVAPPFDEPPPPARAAGGSAPLATATPTPVCGQGSWVGRAPYPIAIEGHAMVALDDQLFSFGGDSQGIRLRNAYRYEPATDTWTQIADLPAERTDASAVTDGRYVYIMGGYDNAARIQYPLPLRPLTDSYTSLAPALRGAAEAALVYLTIGSIASSGSTITGSPSPRSTCMMSKATHGRRWARSPTIRLQLTACRRLPGTDTSTARAVGAACWGALQHLPL